MDRLKPLDVAFLHVEDHVSHMNIGSVGLYEGPAPGAEDLAAAITAKLHLAPRFRQRVRFVPLEAGRPVWSDDPHFELGYHLRRTALPAPGGDDELRRLVGRVMSQQLDRTKPLWEMWAVEGLEGGRWALISKLHHAMVDGVSGSRLITAVMDDRADAPPGPAVPWEPAPEPAAAELLRSALADGARLPLRELEAAAGSLRDPGGLAAHAVNALRGLGAYAGLVRAPESSSLNGPVGVARRWDFARATLAEVKEIRTALGGSVNDVVLALIARGFRDLLAERGESTDRVLRTLVPVSVRSRTESGVYDNKVSAMFADLPVYAERSIECLQLVQSHMRELKQTHEAEAGELLTTLGEVTPELLLSFGGRLATRLPQHYVNTVTTNVPGPQAPLYLSGRRLLESFPYVPVAGHVRVGVAIYSYDGHLGFGVTGDYDTAPDLRFLCAGIERGLGELLAARLSSR